MVKKTWIVTLLEWYAVGVVMVLLEDIVMVLQRLYWKLLPHTRKLLNAKNENKKTLRPNMILLLKDLMKSQQLTKSSKKSLCHIFLHHLITIGNVVCPHLRVTSAINIFSLSFDEF